MQLNVHDFIVIILHLSADPSIHSLSDQTTVRSTQLTGPNCNESCSSSRNIHYYIPIST